MSDGTKDVPKAEDVSPSVVSWIARIVSAVCVGGLLIYMVTKAVADTAPNTFGYSVLTESVLQHEGLFSVDVEITNRGTNGITSLVFEAEQGEETRTLQLHTLGPGETRGANIWVPADPRTVPLRLSTLSFVQ